jgi:hypothetical protein
VRSGRGNFTISFLTYSSSVMLDSRRYLHMPSWQVPFPPLHGCPFSAIASKTHPFAGSHRSCVHVLLSSQNLKSVEKHTPLLQWSLSVQALPSSQRVLLGSAPLNPP